MILQNDLFNQAHSIAKKWGSKAFFSFLDQGIYSGTNFTINILLARWLSPTSYGAFSVAFSIYLLLSGCITALVLEPMSVFGPTRHKDHLPLYIKKLTLIQIGISLILALIVTITALFVKTELKFALFGLSASIPFSLLIWLYRRAFYINFKPNLAARISIIYSVLTINGIIILFVTDQVTSTNVFLLMGAASVVSSFFAWLFIKSWDNKTSPIKECNNTKDILLENWNYGYWILGASIANGVSNYLYLPIIGLFLNLSEAAAFRAMENLLLPIQQVIAAITLLALPNISLFVHEKGIRKLKKKNTYYMLIITFVTLSYSLVIFLFRIPIIRAIYQNPFYEHYSWLLLLLLGSFLISNIGLSYGITIRALKKPKGVLWSKLISSVFFLTLGIFAIYLFRLEGVIISKYIVATVETTILILFLGFYFSRHYGSQLEENP